MKLSKEDKDKLKHLLKQVADHFDKEDSAVRERQIRTWRKLKLYWDGLNIYYSEVAHDWRIWDDQNRDEDNDQAYYDKRVNIYRAYLESIIAALSITTPSIKCFPDDAENPLDLATAKAGDKIAELVGKHNDIGLLWLHSLFIYCTEGMVAAYRYTKEDEKYGTYEEPKYEDETIQGYVCPTCKAPLNAELFTARETDEFQPGNDDILVNDAILNRDMVICPECSAQIDPEHPMEDQVVSRLVGITSKPKSRQCIEVYGGLYVKIPSYAMKQSDIPYLRFSYETHYANVIERFPDARDKVTGQSKVGSASGISDPYEAWGRLSSQYNGEYPTNTITVNNYWFRPAAFNILTEEETEFVKKHLPNGCKFIRIGNEYCADPENEALDDCWILTYNPLADQLNHDPIGMLLTSIQDITNDIVSLTLQTIEHGIPQTFADPGTLNFDVYRQTETLPGAIYPATPKAGKTVGDGFHEVKTATLSGEILPFGQNIQQMGQLVSGALPALFGGVSEGSSKTASEYSMSRAQALQRLQSTWKIFTTWYKNIFGKVIPAYMKDMKDDERIVEKDDKGGFLNTFIRKADLQGKIGSIELEASEQLPATWSQRKDVVMEILKGGNEQVLAQLFAPENLPIVREAIGLNDFIIPGEADRQKQFEEIQQLINSEPIVMPPDETMMIEAEVMGQEAQPIEQPSVEIDPDLDNHEIEAEICRHWLISDAGRLAKIDNQQGYRNVLLHFKAHLQVIQMRQMQAQMQAQAQTEENGTSQSEPKEKQSRVPIGGENAA